jgi:antitoxin PrlF
MFAHTNISLGETPLTSLFLDFLFRDIARQPERLQPIDARLVQRLQALVGGSKIDFDAPLSADDD